MGRSGVTQQTSIDISIDTWIQQLGSAAFAERLSATQKLREAGDAAIAPLTVALEKAAPEQKARIQSLLESLRKNSFSGMLSQLSANPTAEMLVRFPEWSRYSTIVGTSQEDRQFYLRLLRAESKLFTVAAKDVRSLRTPLRSRAAELLQDTREAVRNAEPIKMDSYASLLLLAGNSQLILRGDTSTSLNSLLMSSAFETQVEGADGRRLLKLAGAYIQRPNIAVVDPLRFARKFQTDDGLKLARRVLRSVLRGVDGQMALIVVKEQGDSNDLPLVESLIDHSGILSQGRRSAVGATQSYTATNGDLALAVAIALRGQDPRDFGFSTIDNVGVEFRFAPDTIGFLSDEARKSSRQKYQKRWPSKADL
ncbi:MAG: hypothetical protein ABJZ55_16860 [Fuerstiella sp.]